MNTDVKALWVAALWGNRFRQIRNWLADTSNGRCCLGVLCDLAADAGVGHWEEGGELEGRHRTFVANDDPIDASSGVLPVAVRRWAGLGESDPRVGPPSDSSGNRTNLSVLNDKGKPFTEIADLIEEHL